MESVDLIAEEIKVCKKDMLWKTRIHPVPGVGPADAKIMLIGQNPGAQENKTGLPFVGRSGKYLDKVLMENGLSRDKLFITSVVKCATPNNRKPNEKEIHNCMPYLMRQIEAISPKIIVLMGEVAWKIPRTRKCIYIATYHPSAAMRFPSFQLRFENDFQKIRILANQFDQQYDG